MWYIFIDTMEAVKYSAQRKYLAKNKEAFNAYRREWRRRQPNKYEFYLRNYPIEKRRRNYEADKTERLIYNWIRHIFREK